MVKRLIVLAFAFTVTDWELVCGVLEVDPTHLIKPEVRVVADNHKALMGDWATYKPNEHRIYISEDCPHFQRVLWHEYAHAAMFSNAYQEMMAEMVTEQLKYEQTRNPRP